MAYTGKLGTSDSRPANIILGGDAPAEGGGGGEIEQQLEDVLVIVDEVHSNLITLAVSSDLELEDEALYQVPYHLDVSNTISLTQTARSSIMDLSVSSVLDLDDEVTGSILDLSVTDTLNLVDVAAANFYDLEVSSVLELEDEVELAPGTFYSREASSAMSLEDTVEVHYGVANISIEDTLAGDGVITALLRDQVNFVYELSIEDTITLTEEVFRIFAFSHSLGLVETVEYDFGITAENDLEISDELEWNAEYGRSLSSVLQVYDTIAYSVETTSIDCEYGITVGEVDDPEIEPPSATPPTLGTATLTLTWPYITPTTTLVLRNPEFNNNESHGWSRINRTSRGGDLEIFADPDWPKTKTLSLTIDALTAAEAEDFLEFLEDSLGQEIGLLDWENRQWRGIITTPDAEVTDQGKSCKRSITFEFEGDLV